MRRTTGLLTLALLGILNCSDPAGPHSFSSLNLAGVSVALSVSPSSAAPGESLRLTVTARNFTDRRIQIGIGSPCGPPLDAIITSPGGHRVSVLQEMVGDAVFTCQLDESHFVDPGEAEILRLTWRAPQLRGQYTAVAGIRGERGQLHTLSSPTGITVH